MTRRKPVQRARLGGVRLEGNRYGVVNNIGHRAGPFLGHLGHGKLEDRKSIYQRKLDIFKILMATRANSSRTFTCCNL